MRYLIAAALLAPAVLLGWPAAAEPPSCASLGGSVEAGQMCRVHATGPNYMLTMTFPTDYPDQQALTDYITQNRDGFVNVAQSSGGRDQPYQLEATTDQHSAGQPPHNTRSVVLKFFQDVGGTRSSIWYKAFNYNLGTKQPITFDSLFPPGTTPLDAIFPIVQRDLERQTPLGAAILPSTGHDPSHYQNFAITDDQLIFYFAPGEMLPAFGGPAQAQVPRNAIPPLAI
ncbi:esterase [Mycobacterium intracellulare]|uniref:esterase n=1 Tax=Mycobacterium intracellulare TaxID=1767 RepID=UPI00355650AF